MAGREVLAQIGWTERNRRFGAQKEKAEGLLAKVAWSYSTVPSGMWGKPPGSEEISGCKQQIKFGILLMFFSLLRVDLEGILGENCSM